jgi:hypothetical protein
MRGLVGALALRAAGGSGMGPSRVTARPRAHRNWTPHKGAAAGALIALVVAVLGGSLFTTRARAGIEGEYQLEFGFAKRAISHETAQLCNETQGCVNWAVRPCRRRSWHRVDCLSRLYGENGTTCSFVAIAVWPPSSNHLILHHKRFACSSARSSRA